MKTLFYSTKHFLIAGIGLLAMCLPVNAQSAKIQFSGIDHLAQKASETVDVNVDERLIQLAAKFLTDKDDVDLKALVVKLKGVYVKNFEFETDGAYTPADVETIRSQVSGPSWSKLMVARSKKEGNLEVYVLLEGENVGGLVVIGAQPRELTIVNIVGPVDLQKLASLEGQFGIPALDLDLEKNKPVKKKNEQ